MNDPNEKRLRRSFSPVLVLAVALVASLLATTAVWGTVTWAVDDSIVVTITSPAPGSVWLADSQNTLSCSATGDDEWQEDASDPWQGPVDDGFVYSWTGSGTFPYNYYIGSSVEYISPWMDGYDNITATATDTNPFLADNAGAAGTAVLNEEPIVYIVGFNGTYQLYQTPAMPASQWDDSTVAIPYNAIYNAGDLLAVSKPKNYMCTLRGAGVTAMAQCRVSVPLTKAADVSLRATGAYNWDWGTCSIAANSQLSSVANCSQIGTLPNVVTASEITMDWHFKEPGGANVDRAVNSTSHTCI